MSYSLQQNKLRLQELIRNSHISEALILSESLLKEHHDTDLLLTHIQLQLVAGDLSGCRATRKLINISGSANPSLNRQLYSIFKKHSQYQLAAEELRIVLNEVGDDKSLYQELAALYIHIKRYDDAITLLEEAVELFPHSSHLFLMLGASYQSIQDIEHALMHYKNAYNLDSNNIDAIVGIAGIHYLHRRYDESMDVLKSALDLKPYHFSALDLYSKLAMVTHSQESAINLLCDVPDSSLSPQQQSMKYFSLGRLHDEIKNYELSFEYYSKANSLIPNDYNQYAYDEYFAAIEKCYTRDKIEKLKRVATDSKRLVFIVGMPRSGTSLAEQILSSHHEVYGSGELNKLGGIIKQLSGKGHLTTNFPYFVDEINERDIESLAGQYIEEIESIDQKHRLVTDKTVNNFHYLGLINILFPQAKIIHCTRNPYDTCLSCYFQQFSGHYPYAYQLDNLAHYYSVYQRLMSHWNSNLTKSMFELNYESLIKDEENVIRQLLEYCELDWSNDCLAFNKSNRAVTTASSQQVGKALYNKSVERWRNYESFLKPLISAFNHNDNYFSGNKN